MTTIKLTKLDTSFLLSQIANDKHITYIDTINKQYRIATTRHNPIVANYGDIFSTCYNLHQSGYNLPLLDHINIDELKDSINNKILSKSIKDLIQSYKDTSFNFQLGIFKNKPIFYINCLISDLFLYDLINAINDNNIKIKICDKCKQCFTITHYNQKWCNKCLSNDKTRKEYNREYYKLNNSIGSCYRLKRTIYTRVKNRFDSKLYPDKCDKEYLDYIYKLLDKYSKDIDALYKINALDFIRIRLLLVYIEHINEISPTSPTSKYKLYEDMFKCDDIVKLEAWFSDKISVLYNTDINTLIEQISLNELKNKRINDYNKQAIRDELSILLNSK